MCAGQSSMAPARKHHKLPGITGSPLAKWSFHLQLRGKGDLCESVCMCAFAWACLWVLLLSPGNTLWSKWDWNALIRLHNSCCVTASTISGAMAETVSFCVSKPQQRACGSPLISPIGTAGKIHSDSLSYVRYDLLKWWNTGCLPWTTQWMGEGEYQKLSSNDK